MAEVEKKKVMLRQPSWHHKSKRNLNITSDIPRGQISFELISVGSDETSIDPRAEHMNLEELLKASVGEIIVGDRDTSTDV
jgi:hypothetical protein